ncbi:ead/Ea22-like family protein [Klebsiella pneumoniae]|uniref:ead/Ea22-like family protein n=2 Tax=Klebsiella TaxID=570 RepID=UPI0006933836|nr:ead/Ea22-like family protein [Klebsiella pneumoniae]HBR4811081.1 ead/Ea22-like family protein [Klebsiella pneumoniae]HCJ2302221.1 ead/Ea22-like family protein [Klebsiella pneumoniae]HCJ2532116.1 ead/Ea22-like family protein [Klebsiella pneumoniae]HCJ3066529.1 ead/Ea22-like family protein [Klebsiella pneumoniae]HDT7262177.1 ead/Ea22-like family protein [Klebsiella pneumoniae]
MTDITELAQSLKAAAEKATQGEWWADEVKNEGCYGSGDDCVEGFTSYAIYGSDGQTLFDSLNSDAACICEEYDGEGHVAWDETAQRNAEFIALANPANVLALVEALEKAQQVDEELCRLLPPGAEYMDPPDGGDVTPLEGVRRMVADYRQRIAELESRAVTAAAADVLAERKRQVTAEGWTPGHDDEYEHGELADAAGCYALSSELFDCAGEPPRPWPWPDEWWKPTNRRRDLVKAGALILAEIERLDRTAGIKVEAE